MGGKGGVESLKMPVVRSTVFGLGILTISCFGLLLLQSNRVAKCQLYIP